MSTDNQAKVPIEFNWKTSYTEKRRKVFWAQMGIVELRIEEIRHCFSPATYSAYVGDKEVGQHYTLESAKICVEEVFIAGMVEFLSIHQLKLVDARAEPEIEQPVEVVQPPMAACEQSGIVPGMQVVFRDFYTAIPMLVAAVNEAEDQVTVIERTDSLGFVSSTFPLSLVRRNY